MVKVAVGLFIGCAVMAMVAFTLIELMWLGLVVLVLAAGALIAGFVFNRLEDRPHRLGSDPEIHAGSTTRYPAFASHASASARLK